MNITDPIADLLTRIRNAQQAKHDVLSVPASKMKIAITYLLKREGFIKAYKCVRDNKQGLLKIALRYDDKSGSGIILGIDRKSKPGRRYYVDKHNLPKVKKGYGVAIISTSKGIMTCSDASKEGVGGEYLCSVY
jgi:small subunit ribosomal protein S8